MLDTLQFIRITSTGCRAQTSSFWSRMKIWDQDKMCLVIMK